MVAVAVDLAARQRPAVDYDTIDRFLRVDAEILQALRHDRDTVALLDP